MDIHSCGSHEPAFLQEKDSHLRCLLNKKHRRPKYVTRSGHVYRAGATAPLREPQLSREEDDLYSKISNLRSEDLLPYIENMSKSLGMSKFEKEYIDNLEDSLWRVDTNESGFESDSSIETEIFIARSVSSSCESFPLSTRQKSWHCLPWYLENMPSRESGTDHMAHDAEKTAPALLEGAKELGEETNHLFWWKYSMDVWEEAHLRDMFEFRSQEEPFKALMPGSAKAAKPRRFKPSSIRTVSSIGLDLRRGSLIGKLRRLSMEKKTFVGDGNRLKQILLHRAIASTEN